MTDQKEKVEMDVDESLYSRQLLMLGKEAMQKMAEAKILLVGMSGLGVEIAKNIILAGVQQVAILDPETIELNDLSAQFFFTKEDIGKNRAEVSCPKLKELNEYVKVECVSNKLNEEFIKNYTVVVLCSQRSLSEILEIGEICHRNKIKFIVTDTMGVFGFCFNDFGEKFVVVDQRGEPPLTTMIGEITKEKNGRVTNNYASRHGFETGDHVIFSEIPGMTELNGQIREITVENPFEFTIGDTSNYGDYTFEGSGGYATQVFVPKEFDFKSIQESIIDPEFFISDSAKEERPIQLHIAIQAIYKYMEEKKLKRLDPHDEKAVEEIFKIIETIPKPKPKEEEKKEEEKIEEKKEDEKEDEKVEEKKTEMEIQKEEEEKKKKEEEEKKKKEEEEKIKKEEEEKKKQDEKDLITSLVYSFTGELSPMCAFFGGVIGQEVIKACSGKYTPIQQWMYYDATECLPKDYLKMPKEEFIPKTATRYATQISVLGNKVNDAVLNQRYFMIGAGAIGCEMLKNWAMMGLGSGKDGYIHLTDMDTIERSNLNRQFLFRPWDIQKLKAEVATNAAKKMNPEMKIMPHSDKVGKDTEEIYDDEFFESLTGVCNALDNIQARQYVDQRCVFYGKSLLESGTLGPKGNVQVVLPNKTLSYSDIVDPPEASIPQCTLHNFPNKIDHTIQWSRDMFEGLFHNRPKNMDSFIHEKDFIENLQKQPTQVGIETLDQLMQDLISKRPETFEQCVEWARNLFEEFFYNTIVQLLFTFPKDAQNSRGEPFWHGDKRPPNEIKFDMNNEIHLDFIISAANLRAQIYGIKEERDAEKIKQILPNCTVPKFTPRSGFKAQTDDNGEVVDVIDEALEDDTHFETLLKQLPEPEKFADQHFKIHKFEKDDDTNFHIDFITAASNLRAINYSIEPADRLRTKAIAGKIIPAIATTTACVTGLVCLELYKLVQTDKELDDFKDGFLNLALPFFGFSTPNPPFTTKMGNRDYEFSNWDQIRVKGDLTIQELEDYTIKNHKLSISMINVGNSLIYNSFNPKVAAERKPKKITELCESIAKIKISKKRKYLPLTVMFDDSETDESVDAPIVTLVLRD